MECYYDKKTLCIYSKPDCVEEWLELMWDIGADYDGCDCTIEGMKHLVDELLDMVVEARLCLKDNKIFENSENLEKSIEIARKEMIEDLPRALKMREERRSKKKK